LVAGAAIAATDSSDRTTAMVRHIRRDMGAS
jgi:hypothetical protein